MSSSPGGQFTEAEIEELKEAFMVFDKDDSGSITADELAQMLRSIMPEQLLSDSVVKKLLAKFDKNGDGTIDFDEFLSMMQSTQATTKKGDDDELQRAFRVFDRDGDGTISAKEILTVMQALGENVDLETCQLMVKSVDLDGNGTIDVNEFKKMMRDGFAVDEAKQK